MPPMPRKIHRLSDDIENNVRIKYPYWFDIKYRQFIDKKELITDLNGYIQFRQELKEMAKADWMKYQTRKAIYNLRDTLQDIIKELRGKLRGTKGSKIKQHSPGFGQRHFKPQTNTRDTQLIKWFE